MGYIANTMSSYWEIAGLRGVLTYISSKIPKVSVSQKICTVNRTDVKYNVYLRLPTSDVLTYWRIFINKEYNLATCRAPNVIVDAGANIGLASVYFANRFPDARIIAIEPEKSNFELLLKNVAPYKNVIPILAVLWNENKDISLVDPGLGNSGFMTQEENPELKNPGRHRHLTKGITVDQIIKDYSIEKIDILKVDIEGAECEVFSSPSSWIGKVDSLIVELHERMKPGCNRAFFSAIQDFGNQWTQGENVYVSRVGGCLVRPPAA